MASPPALDFYQDFGLNAEIYDLRTSGNAATQDLKFYRNVAKASGGAVLELGAGTGRVSLPLARTGLDVTGLDLSPGMLRLANQKREREPSEVQARLHFVAGDMRNFEFSRQFATVLIPFRGFMVLLTPEDQRSCLHTVHRHLAPGGVLTFAVFDPLLRAIADERPEFEPRLEFDGEHPTTGNRVQVRVLSRTNDRLAQTFAETWEFTEFASDGSVLRSEQEVLRMRWTYRHEMRYLLELSGFQVEAEYSDFDGSPPAFGKEQVWVARKQG